MYFTLRLGGLPGAESGLMGLPASGEGTALNGWRSGDDAQKKPLGDASRAVADGESDIGCQHDRRSSRDLACGRVNLQADGQRAGVKRDGRRGPIRNDGAGEGHGHLAGGRDRASHVERGIDRQDEPNGTTE